MPARRGDLDRPPSRGLPHHVTEIGHGGRIGQRAPDVPGQDGPPAEMIDDLGEGARGQHLDALDQRGLLGIRRGHDHLQVTGPGRGQHRRQHPSDAAHRAVEAQLAEQHQPVDRVRRNGAARREDPGGEREVEAAPLLGHRRRGQADGDPALRKAPAGVDDGRTDPVDRLAHDGVGQTDEHHLRHTGGHVDLHLDHGAVHSGQAHRPGAGEGHENAARRWVTSAGCDGRTRMPTTSNRRSGACSSWAASHRWARTRSRRCLLTVTASTGWP